MNPKKKKTLIWGICIAVLSLAVLTGAIVFAVQNKAPEKVFDKTDDNHLRIATFNIAAYGEPKMSKISAQLDAYGIDAAGFQEVDCNTGRNPRDMMAELAAVGQYPYSDFQKCMDYDGGEYGIAITSALPIVKRDGALFAQKGDIEPMAWHMIEVQKGGRTVHIYNTHLEWIKPEKRHAQMLEMMAILDKDPCPYKILTGDFNTDQDLRENDAMLKHYNLANGYENKWIDTFNKKDKSMKVYAIDNILMTRNLRLVQADAYENKRLSDHNMFYAEFEFLDEPQISRQLLDLYIADAKAAENPSAALTEALKTADALGADAKQDAIDTAVDALESALQK